MDTDALIEALERDAAPVPRRWFERRLGAGLLMSSLAALLLIVSTLGIRPDLQSAAGTIGFWGKAGYSSSLALVGLLLAARLARPETQSLRRTWLIAVPVGTLALFALAELAGAAPGVRSKLIVDPLWTCVPLIVGLSVPLFAAMVWAAHHMAPTNLRGAGAAAGLAAAGFAATLYGLYCQQVSPTYILTRYTVAIALVSAAGALIGPRLLRW